MGKIPANRISPGDSTRRPRKIQVLVTQGEYRELRRRAAEQAVPLARVAHEIISQHLQEPDVVKPFRQITTTDQENNQ